MVVTDRRMTADEFLALPPDARHAQLIDGELVLSDPTLRHQRLVAELFYLLAAWAREQPDRGEPGIGCNVRVDEQNVFVPDVWWVSEEHRRARDAAWFDGSPDLVAEVRSPSTWRYDIGKKREGYFRSGLKELWLLDTAADIVIVFRGEEALELGAGDRLTTPQLPGLAIDVAALFDR